MNIAHHITLSENDWNDFVFRLNHRDPVVAQNIAAFWADVQTSMDIRVEGNSTFVSSDSIDEDAILSVLLANNDAAENSANEPLVICIDSPLTLNAQLIHTNVFAELDCYYAARKELTYQDTHRNPSISFAA